MSLRASRPLPREKDCARSRRSELLAEVRLKGKDSGVVWTKLFRVEITEAMESEGNMSELDRVELWVNRVRALSPRRHLSDHLREILWPLNKVEHDRGPCPNAVCHRASGP